MSNPSNLTAEEKEILADYEQGSSESIATSELRSSLIDAGRQTFKKDKRVNIRMSGKDLELLQARALRDGIPYQTLMASVLHKFVNGRFVDRDA